MLLRSLRPALVLAACAAAPLALAAQAPSAAPGAAAPAAGYSAVECADCAAWNAPRAPLRVFGNTYYVGTRGLSALLVTSPAGHVLVDAGLPESAPLIRANVRALGFRMEDVKLIVNSHAHFDHAGGVAELQRASGATVAASPWSAKVIATGVTAREDPQFDIALKYPAAGPVKVIADGDTLRAGTVALVAHFTPGHTPGGTSWSWRSCEGTRCLDIVYADSQTPVSADGFLFTRSAAYPTAVADFERGHAALERLSCDVLVTPHPSASQLWERIARRDGGEAGALVDREACRRYAAGARAQLAKRVERERTAH